MPPSSSTDAGLTGRCYCGSTTLATHGPPLTVAYCHCLDCRRVTGAALAAFAAFAEADVKLTPEPTPVSHTKGVTRWFCPQCGSPLKAKFDYIPGQIYVPVGIMDDADAVAPKMHCYINAKPQWLHLSDELPRETGSGRAKLLGDAP